MKSSILCLYTFFTATSYQTKKTGLVHKTHQVEEENEENVHA